MKCRRSTVWLIWPLFLLPLLVMSQSMMEVLPNFKTSPRYALLNQFYVMNGAQPVWISNFPLQQEFLRVLQQAPSLGLITNDYSYELLKSYAAEFSLQTKTDSLEADIRFTDAALYFFTSLFAGKKAPEFYYTGLSYSPQQQFPLQLLKDGFQHGYLSGLVEKLQPKAKVYSNALQLLGKLQHMKSTRDFREVRIVSSKVDSTNVPLVLRLYQLGILGSINDRLTKTELTAKIKAAQKLFDLPEDGLLRRSTRDAINLPLARRIEELRILLNTLRWLEPIRQAGPVLVVNLPSATCFVYEKGKQQLFSKLIVGKPATPTPTLTSTLTEVVLYPYWRVPHKIAVRELLPAIKKDVGYLERGNYQVLNKEGKVLNPYSINWHSLNGNYFPYLIRQSTGCDNALGLVKFNFQNPFTVYLHDTPTKPLFLSTRRFYSYGCMRLDKPIELARYVLGFNRIAIDTLIAKGCLNHQAPLPVPVQKRLPVVVLYSTAWYNEHGELRFYEDCYNKLNGPLLQTVALQE